MRKHPWMTNQKKQVFTQPYFDLIDKKNWNEELPVLYERINSLEDDRSFVILMSIIVEFHLDKLLSIVIPDYDTKLKNNKDLTFSLKLELLNSMRLIPKQIFLFADCIRKIRNEFAHNLKIDNILELKTLNRRSIVLNLEQLCAEYSDSLVYSKSNPSNYIQKFKDIANFVVNAFREYEPNFIALRKEIDSEEFEENLSKKVGNKMYKNDSIY